MRQRPDPLTIRPADAAGDEPLDAALLIDDAECRVLGMGKFADSVRDELQDAVQVQDAGDAAGGRVERGELVGGLAGASTGPGCAHDDLEAAGTFVDGEDRCRRRIETQLGQDAIAETELVGPDSGRLLSRASAEVARTNLDLGQRRSVQVEVAAAQPGTADDAVEGRGELGIGFGPRIGMPAIQRF